MIDQCGDPANRSITLLSYLHIAFQPLFLNAFAMEIAPRKVPARLRAMVFAAAAICTGLLLMRLAPLETLGTCRPGGTLCGPDLCLVSGTWHIGWEIPLNGMWHPLSEMIGFDFAFPDYVAAVFLLPLAYGAWRFVLVHLFAGPVLALLLTSDPNEMPAVWCLFSIGILLIALSPRVRYGAMRAHHPEAG